MLELKNMGLHFVLNDFGVGYISLDYFILQKPLNEDACFDALLRQ